MNYNLANVDQANAAMQYMVKLIDKGARVELKQLRGNRTLNQNSYLHLLLGAFGLHFGYTLEESKAIYKQLNRAVYFYTKGSKGDIELTTFAKSSADLDTKEMTRTIDRFREWSNEHGCYLPPATNSEELLSIQNAMERSGYL